MRQGAAAVNVGVGPNAFQERPPPQFASANEAFRPPSFERPSSSVWP